MNEKLKNINENEVLLPSWLVVDDKGKMKVNEVEFCKEFLKLRALKCIDGQFRDMDGIVSDCVIRHEISQILTEHIIERISYHVKNLIEALKLKCYSDSPKICEDEIHLLNGILKTNGTFSSELRFCINRINVNYDPTVPPPKIFMCYLLDLLSPDDITTLQEYFGYLLIPSTRGQAMLSIIGPGGEGKSVLGIIIKAIFGNSMVEGSFRRIETDRFFRANLKDKLVFVDDDLQLEALPSTGYIKTLVTIQTPTDIEFKNRQSFSEKLYARFLCFGNGSVKSLRDKSYGFSRRMIVLSTKPVPIDRIKNPQIAEIILTEREGIFNWMFAGLQRLIANNYQFALSEKAKLNASELASDNCNIIEFLSTQDTVIFSESVEISSAILYDSYSKWCRENALEAIKREPFISWTKSNQEKYNISYTNHIRTTGGKHVRGFKGIKIVS
jgi:putative DNA primase/helicase